MGIAAQKIYMNKSAIGNYIYLHEQDYFDNKQPSMIDGFDQQSLYQNLKDAHTQLSELVTFQAQQVEKKNAKYIENVMNDFFNTNKELQSIVKGIEDIRDGFKSNLEKAINADFDARLSKGAQVTSLAEVDINRLLPAYSDTYLNTLKQANQEIQKAFEINGELLSYDNANAKTITEVLRNIQTCLSNEKNNKDSIVTNLKTQLQQLRQIAQRTTDKAAQDTKVHTTSISYKNKSKTATVTTDMMMALDKLLETLENSGIVAEKNEMKISTALGTFLIHGMQRQLSIPAVYIGDTLEYAAAIAAVQALQTGKIMTEEEMRQVIKQNVKGGLTANPGLIQANFALDFVANDKDTEIIKIKDSGGTALISTMASQNKIDLSFPLPNNEIAQISAKNLNIQTHTNFHIVSGTHLFNLIQTIPVITNHWINLLNADKNGSEETEEGMNRDMGLFIIAKGLRGDVAKFSSGKLTIESADYMMMHDTSMKNRGFAVKPMTLILSSLSSQKILKYTRQIRSDIQTQLREASKEAKIIHDFPDINQMQKRINDLLVRLKNISVNITLNTRDVYEAGLAEKT